MILKRVLFEAFDAYIVLFYLTVYERNIHLLRLELVGAFNVDTFRRVFVECILPWVAQKKLLSLQKKEATAASKKEDITELITTNSLVHETDLEDYEQFGKYKRRIIFGLFE